MPILVERLFEIYWWDEDLWEGILDLLTQIAIPNLKKWQDGSLYIVWIDLIYQTLLLKDDSIPWDKFLILLTKICSSFERPSYHFPGITQQEDTLWELFLKNGVLAILINYESLNETVNQAIKNCEPEDFSNQLYFLKNAFESSILASPKVFSGPFSPEQTMNTTSLLP